MTNLLTTTDELVEALKGDRYVNQLLWNKGSAEDRAAYHAENARIVKLFKADLENVYGVKDHPKADKIWALAWDFGHSAGYSDVYYYYDDLVELIK